MRDNGKITLEGLVLGTEHKSGTSKAGQPYAFDIVSVLTGKTVSEVQWSANVDDLGPAPREDEKITVVVELDVYAGRQQIKAIRRLASGARAAAPAA